MSSSAQLLSALGRFAHEARRRRLPQAAIGYAALVWILIQFGGYVFEALGWPGWAMRGLLAALALGFPIAMVFAWFFDLTPEGLRRDLLDAAAAEPKAPHLAAILVVRPVEGATIPNAELRRLLTQFHCTELELEGTGLAAEFVSSRDAIDCALHILRLGGERLRAGVSLGDVVRDAGHFLGAASSDAHALVHHAAPGGLALSSAFVYSALSHSHPGLAAQLVPAPGATPSGEPHALLADAATLAALEPPRAPESRPRSVPGLALLTLAMSMLIALVVGGVLWFRQTSGGAGPPRASIAVLPFSSLSNDRDDAYFADGLADELMDALAGVKGLQVAARSSVNALRDQKVDMKELRKSLNVATVLSASVRRVGSRVRISAQLSDTQTGFALWATSYDRELTDIFALQREIAGNVTRNLLGVLPNDGKPLTERLSVTNSVAAFDAYLRGKQILEAATSEKAVGEAIDQFASALTLDSRFARAQAGVCSAEFRRYQLSLDAQALPRAEAACTRAAEMDPSVREVSLAQGALYAARGDSGKAMESYTRTLDNPLLRADAYVGMAKLEASAGHAELALEYFDRARKLDPGNWRIYQALGTFRRARHQYAEAIESFRTAIGLAPDSTATSWNSLGSVYLVQDDYEQAAEAFNRSVALDPNHMALSNLGIVRFLLGDYASAADLFRRASELAPGDYRTWGNIADALGADPKSAAKAPAAYRRAIEVAQRSLENRPPNAEATAMLSWYHANLGERELALELAAKAEAAAPDNADVSTWTALTMARLGDPAAARTRVQLALKQGASRRSLASQPALKGLVDGPAPADRRPRPVPEKGKAP